MQSTASLRRLSCKHHANALEMVLTIYLQCINTIRKNCIDMFILCMSQANYFANPLPVELFPTISAYEDVLITDTQICEVMDYPLKTLVFMSKNLKSLVALVTKICSTLHSQNTAFNLLITDCGTKIYLFPQVKCLLNLQTYSSLICFYYVRYHIFVLCHIYLGW